MRRTYSIGKNGSVVLMPANQDDPRRRQPNINRAIKELGWRPVVKSLIILVHAPVLINNNWLQVSLKEGIQRTIDYFKYEIGTVKNN